MKSFPLSLFWCLLACLVSQGLSLNLRPIIGILSQEPTRMMMEGEDKNCTSYVAASYVKFYESAGARIVPILINQEESYYKHIAASVNGILFPGGISSFQNDSGYGMAGQILYKEVLNRNADGHYLPLWATCLGFEMLAYLSANYVDLREICDTYNVAVPLIPLEREGNRESLIFKNMPSDIYDILTSQNVTVNFHYWCITVKGMTTYHLDQDYHLLTKNYDAQNFEFLTTIEHKRAPIFGTQWHPEKNAYEWKHSETYDSIPHSMDAIYAAQYFADFMVSQARLSDQHFATEAEELSSLIENHKMKHMTDVVTPYVQVYLIE